MTARTRGGAAARALHRLQAMPPRSCPKLIASLSLCLAACGGDSGDGPRGDAGPDPDAPAGGSSCDPAATGDEATGVIRIGTSDGQAGTTSTLRGVLVGGSGWFFSGLAPQRQHVSAEEGDCVLYEWEPSFCDPACTTGLCDDGECHAYPRYLSAGAIQVSIAGGDPIEVDPDAPSFWGMEYRATLASPPGPGDEVSVCATGADTAGFAADLQAVGPLDGDLVPEDRVFPLADGGDRRLSWSGAEAGARVRLTLNADNEAHGLPFRAILQCDAPDTGELVVPQALIEAFPAIARPPENFGCSGTDCPLSEIVRYRAARVSEGGLDLEIRAEAGIEFRVAH
jgi:hypothetical protein